MLGYCFSCDQYHDTYQKNDDTFCPLLENEIPPMIEKIWKLKKHSNTLNNTPFPNANSSSAPPTDEVDFLQFYLDTNEKIVNQNRRGDSINILRSIEKIIESQTAIQKPNSKIQLNSDDSIHIFADANTKAPNIINSTTFISKKGQIPFNTREEHKLKSTPINNTAHSLSVSNEIHKLSANFRNLEIQVKSIIDNQSCFKNPYYRNSNNIFVRDQSTFTKDQVAFKPESKTYDQKYVDKLIADNKKKVDEAFRNGFNAGFNASIQNLSNNSYNIQRSNHNSIPAIAYFNNDESSIQQSSNFNDNFFNSGFHSYNTQRYNRSQNRGRGTRRYNQTRR